MLGYRVGRREVAVGRHTRQRSDCRALRPWDEVDPEYARLLRRAVTVGVEALPYRARVRAAEIELAHPLPALL